MQLLGTFLASVVGGPTAPIGAGEEGRAEIAAVLIKYQCLKCRDSSTYLGAEELTTDAPRAGGLENGGGFEKAGGFDKGAGRFVCPRGFGRLGSAMESK